MERRTLLAVILSVFILILWQNMFMPKRKRIVKKEIRTKAEEPYQHKERKVRLEKIPEAEIRVKTENSEIAFTSKGGSIIGWELKERIGKINIVNPESPLPERLQIETVPDIAEREFKTDTSRIKQGEIVFTTILDGLFIEKRFIFQERGYEHLLEIVLENRKETGIKIGDVRYIWEGKVGDEKERKGIKNNVTALVNKKFFKNPDSEDLSGKVRWIALGSQYFMVSFLNQEVHFNRGIAGKQTREDLPYMGLVKSDVFLSPGQKQRYRIKLFVGPKRYRLLKKSGEMMEKSIDFGLFSFLSVLFLHALTFFHKLTGNYGWSIILMTCFIQLFLSPLSRKSYKSMHAMKRLQPKIEALRIKYKDDPKRLNIEMMNLYKSAKVNPFGGCLPMLLQLPIFWALFMMLRNAVELRKAEFIFWVKDLSNPDTLFRIGGLPLNVLPLLMGISMLVQQKITTTDPSQSKMMMFMPILFTFIFWNFPSGLVLYWLVNNILSILHQWLLVKKMS